MNNIVDKTEHARAHAATREVDFYAQALEASKQFRSDYKARMNVVKVPTCPSSARPTG